MVSLWDFTALVATERRTRLLGLKGFEDVLKQVTSMSTVLEYESEPFKGSRLKVVSEQHFFSALIAMAMPHSSILPSVTVPNIV